MRFAAITLTAALVLGVVPLAALATVLDYQTAVQSNAELTQLWSFDGDTDAERLANSVLGGAGLSLSEYPGAETTLNVAGFDTTSKAVEFNDPGGVLSEIFEGGDAVTVELLFKKTGGGGAANWAVFQQGWAADGERGSFITQGKWEQLPDGSWLVDPDYLGLSLGTDGYPGHWRQVSDSFLLDRWYFVAVAASYNDVAGTTTVNAWTADLTAGQTTLTQTLTNETLNGDFSASADPHFYIGTAQIRNELPVGSGGEGLVDEVAIYSAALTGGEVQSHLDAIGVPEPAGLTLLLGAIASLCLFRCFCVRRR